MWLNQVSRLIFSQAAARVHQVTFFFILNVATASTLLHVDGGREICYRDVTINKPLTSRKLSIKDTIYYGKDDQPNRFYQATFVIIGPRH
jgi:hypothetical protein